MYDEANQLQKAFSNNVYDHEEPAFEEIWPTESRGDGIIVANNFRTGAAQGKSSMIRKAHCRLCGFPNDLVAVDHSGGSIDGLGAGGGITTQVASAPLAMSAVNYKGPTTHTENAGTQAFKKGSGCALCFSKNSTGMRVDALTFTNPWDKLSLTGFVWLFCIIIPCLLQINII